jgi:outer membrane lipoprotein SlyB
VSVLVLSACTFPSSGTTYERDQVGRLMRVENAEVISVRDIVIEGSTDTRIGALGGAAVGSAATMGVGSGPGTTGTALAQAGGAIAGAVVGNAVEDYVTRKEGQEVTVRLRTGELRAVVRETNYDPLLPGDQVQLLTADGGMTTVKRL